MRTGGTPIERQKRGSQPLVPGVRFSISGPQMPKPKRRISQPRAAREFRAPLGHMRIRQVGGARRDRRRLACERNRQQQPNNHESHGHMGISRTIETDSDLREMSLRNPFYSSVEIGLRGRLETRGTVAARTARGLRRAGCLARRVVPRVWLPSYLGNRLGNRDSVKLSQRTTQLTDFKGLCERQPLPLCSRRPSYVIDNVATIRCLQCTAPGLPPGLPRLKPRERVWGAFRLRRSCGSWW